MPSSTSGTSSRLPSGAAGVSSAKWWAHRGAVASEAAAVAPSPCNSQRRTRPVQVTGGWASAGPRATMASAATDTNDSWNDRSSTSSGDPTSRISAAAAMALASDGRRRNITATSARQAIQAARTVATASPVINVYSRTSGMAAPAASNAGRVRKAMPGTRSNSCRSSRNTRPATAVRCSPDTDSACTAPAALNPASTSGPAAVRSPRTSARSSAARGPGNVRSIARAIASWAAAASRRGRHHPPVPIRRIPSAVGTNASSEIPWARACTAGSGRPGLASPSVVDSRTATRRRSPEPR